MKKSYFFKLLICQKPLITDEWHVAECATAKWFLTLNIPLIVGGF